MVRNFWEVNFLWELPSRWAEFCEILSHSVRYDMYVTKRKNGMTSGHISHPGVLVAKSDLLNLVFQLNFHI